MQQGWTSEQEAAQAEAIRSIQELHHCIEHSRLVEDHGWSLQEELEHERAAHDATNQALRDLQRQLDAKDAELRNKDAELRGVRRTLEHRDRECIQAQREINSVMFQQAGGPLGAPNDERARCLAAKVSALESELRLKDLQIDRLTRSSSSASSVSGINGAGSMVFSTGGHKSGSSTPLASGVLSQACAPRDLEVASTMLGSCDDSSDSRSHLDWGLHSARGHYR
mmetsp:Transcript_165639/g.531702  ORF Transcript_165639/g.531702 Transcript_165639/m.531702 type:complete len:225 (-) Transcript_165639:359-1033(-)